jgi:hypothetical protein
MVRTLRPLRPQSEEAIIAVTNIRYALKMNSASPRISYELFEFIQNKAREYFYTNPDKPTYGKLVYDYDDPIKYLELAIANCEHLGIKYMVENRPTEKSRHLHIELSLEQLKLLDKTVQGREKHRKDKVMAEKLGLATAAVKRHDFLTPKQRPGGGRSKVFKPKRYFTL